MRLKTLDGIEITTGKKVWEEKNKIDGSWEFVSFLANYYNIMKNNGHRYCTSCGNKSVRLNYAELSNRDRELGVYLDDADKRYEYDKSRMIEKKMFDDKFIKINTDERYDLFRISMGVCYWLYHNRY